MCRKRLIPLAILTLVLAFPAAAPAKEPPWSGSVIALGQERVKIQSTDIRQRPYRPLHFYGNTIRRAHYRGNPLPMPRDLFRGLGALIGR